jgi:YggT family protein
MGNAYATNAFVFLVQTAFGLYILAVMLRFLLQLVRADFYNPIAQFLVKITNPPLLPLRRVVPGLRGVDLAAVVLLVALKAAELLVIGALVGASFQPAGLFVIVVAELFSLLLNVFLVSILIQVVLSWVAPGTYNPVAALVYRLNAPLLEPAQRLIPPIGGLDLSPIAVIIGIQLLKIVIYAPLLDLGRGLSRAGAFG